MRVVRTTQAHREMELKSVPVGETFYLTLEDVQDGGPLFTRVEPAAAYEGAFAPGIDHALCVRLDNGVLTLLRDTCCVFPVESRLVVEVPHA